METSSLGVRIEPYDFRDDVRDAYGAGARGYMASWPGPHEWMSEERERFQALVAPGSRMLEIGSGPGNDTAYWTEKGLQVVAIDASPEMVELASARFPHCSFRCLELARLDELNEDLFDCAWMSFVILHIPIANAVDNIEKVARHMRSAAPLLLATGLADQTQVLRAPIAGLRSDSGQQLEAPAVFWSEKDIRAMMTPLFAEHWHRVRTPVPGRGQFYSGIWIRR